MPESLGTLQEHAGRLKSLEISKTNEQSGSYMHTRLLANVPPDAPLGSELDENPPSSPKLAPVGCQADLAHPKKNQTLFSMGGSAPQTPRNGRPPAGIGFPRQEAEGRLFRGV